MRDHAAGCDRQAGRRLDGAPTHDTRRSAGIVHEAGRVRRTCRNTDRIDEAGKLADMVVLSRDIMRVPPQEILTTIGADDDRRRRGRLQRP